MSLPMSLQSVELHNETMVVYSNTKRRALQQAEFDKAHGQQGYYIIVDYWGHKYILSDYEIDIAYKQKYPGSVYNPNDITCQSYMNMVQLFIDVYTGKYTFPGDSTPDVIYHVLLRWLPMDVVEAKAWSYDEQDNTPNFTWSFDLFKPWSLNINQDKVELYKLKQKYESLNTHIRDTFALVNTILQHPSDDQLSLTVGLLNPLINMSPEDDVVSKFQETIDLASLLPDVGSEFKEALERFNKTK
jgi:hypothetical protein